MEQELDVYLFHRGEHREVYNYMGAHLTKNSVIFRVWAPHAKSVAVVGDFNNWTGYDHMMKKINNEGIWELEIPNLKKLEKYKYRVESADGRVEMKADPYAFYSEMRPNTASIVYDIPKFKWADKRWLNKRTTGLNKPINIYEVHLGSWKRGIHGEWLNYKDSAVMLAEYLKEMNYTHIEIMPINEYPLDASWGYQATGYYSVTSRYGTPEDFMFLVNLMHKNNIGVILDWVPGHFCKDAHGLYRFDGTPTYEYLDSRIGENKEWGTCNFDVTRNEVKSFLISNLTYWFKEFHIDGVRMDAVANMLYLSYGKDGEDDLRNKYGGKENLGAVDFFKELNSVVHDDFPDVLVVAEDSTAWPNVTKHPIDGGLGFDSKWNMGWMNDTLKYFSIDPIFRYQHHGKLTFSFMYAFSENYVLPLSHDEVVHGKKSIIEKMPGYYEDKLAHTRSLYSYQMAHPGKKLNFMGNEFAHGLEWRFYESLEWHLLDQNNGNKEVQAYVKALNTLYLEDKSLWEDSWDTFEWIEHENYTENMLAFLRKTKDFKEHLVVVFNFSGEDKKKYKIGVPENKVYNIILNSDDKKFGGKGTVKKKKYKPIDKSWNYREQHIELDIPKNTVIFLKTEKVEKKKGGAKGKGTGKEEKIETTVTKSSTKKENKKLAK
ncbi:MULTISPECIES: 1,4-alpha-glucan branching protein GlgB [Fusobacterium]|jgi:1,4-alpha-glucan branching enzyme|uniref:1,4-alpha-glucan branching protein GlgB n=1 Tax=Fusobacterium TaxID=848 RepID=UPI000E534C08|nr:MULTISPECIES: 1,4-alpha-glucan branching protein GlgB [Fusobacterium]MDH6456587.1 1,4-alpha-glucan branching enzyme [Fusobacterium sp. PH5-7]MEE0137887.1 1,4-alpha-glucan branching protein GlgB [Fusobacterium ulcerans]RGY63035.1 1,4-alpha-glucan branching protein GlgB [Fusobacterium ulcerans]